MFATSPPTPTLNGCPERACTIELTDQLPSAHAAGPDVNHRLPWPIGSSHTVYHGRKCWMSKPDGPSVGVGSKKLWTDGRAHAPHSPPTYPLVTRMAGGRVYDTG